VAAAAVASSMAVAAAVPMPPGSQESSLAGRAAAVDERLLSTLRARLPVRGDRSQAWRLAADQV
jgi:hypothetical protein